MEDHSGRAGSIGLFQLLTLSLVPESPKWLAEHRNPQHARHILRTMRGHKANLYKEVKAGQVDSSREDICILSISLVVYGI